jgi:hypothetical protein
MAKKKKEKRSNNDIQNIIKDRATRTPQKPGMNSGAP